MFTDFIDTTLREGQASPVLFDSRKYFFDLSERKKILEGLMALGVRHFEFFSPIVSKNEAKIFAKLRKMAKSIDKKVMLIAHCRCHPEDIKQAMEAGFDGLNLYMGLSTQAQKTYNKSFDEILSIVTKTVREARVKETRWLRFSGEDAFRTDIKRLFKVYDAVADYVDVLGTPDTTGMATAKIVKERIGLLKRRYPKNKIECHFHNDLGMALANSMAAIEAGAEFVDTTIWGIGERSGISSITGLLLNLFNKDKKIVKKYKINNCYPINVLMASMLKRLVPFSEPVSLTNRTHVAGVHQKAVVMNGKSYEAHQLAEFGVNKEELLLGPLSGWNFVHYYLQEVKNYVVEPNQAKEISKTFKERLAGLSEKLPPEKVLTKIADQFGLEKTKIPKEQEERRAEDLSS